MVFVEEDANVIGAPLTKLEVVPDNAKLYKVPL
jgi:hypothetical protein